MSAHLPVRPSTTPARRSTLSRSTLLAALLALAVVAGQLAGAGPAAASAGSGSTSETATSAGVAGSAKSAAVLALAKSLSGKRYRVGGASPSGFDCSGYTQYVYRKAAGRSLPHSADRQQRYGVAVSKSQARPGDLLIFRNGSHGFHAAIYAGGEWMYDAPQPGIRVGKHRIWSRNYVVRRIV